MKVIKQLTVALLLSGMLTGSLTAFAADKQEKKPKPYPLDKCIVTDEKLDADPAMKSYAFTHEGQEIKLCCKSCLKDFKKEPAKYLKKIEEANKNKK